MPVFRQTGTGFGEDVNAGWDRLENKYGRDFRVNIETNSIEHPRTKGTVTRSRTNSAVFFGEYYLSDTVRGGQQIRTVAGPNGYFVVFREEHDRNAPWILGGHQRQPVSTNVTIEDIRRENTGAPGLREIEFSIYHFRSLMPALFQYQGKRLDDLIAPECVALEKSNGPLLQYSFQTGNAGDFPNEKGVILLDPENDFRIVSIIHDSYKDDEVWLHTETTNSAFSNNGLNFTTTQLLETVENGRSMPNSEFTWKISVDTTTRISPDEFKLTYYGIQLEPVNPGAVALWWFLVGGGALLLALAFWVKKRRK